SRGRSNRIQRPDRPASIGGAVGHRPVTSLDSRLPSSRRVSLVAVTLPPWRFPQGTPPGKPPAPSRAPAPAPRAPDRALAGAAARPHLGAVPSGRGAVQGHVSPRAVEWSLSGTRERTGTVGLSAARKRHGDGMSLGASGLRELIVERLNRRKIVVVSNREPY